MTHANSLHGPLAPLRLLEETLYHDVGGRWQRSTRDELLAYFRGHLLTAADHLIRFGRHIGLITGFCVPHEEGPLPETDGPPGSIVLACVLRELGFSVWVLTDTPCAEAVQGLADIYGFPLEQVLCAPVEAHAFSAWLHAWWHSAQAQQLTHLVCVERAGPTHDVSTAVGQTTDELGRQAYEYVVPADHRGRYHTMQGIVIDAFTAPFHELCEMLGRERPEVRTIGIGDGGNELGMGVLTWEFARRAFVTSAAEIIPSRIATDWTVLAGVSNWGAMALAFVLSALKRQPVSLLDWPAARHQECLERWVARHRVIDGVLGRRQATVDGLAVDQYWQHWPTWQETSRMAMRSLG